MKSVILIIILLASGTSLVGFHSPEGSKGLGVAYPQYPEDIARMDIDWWYAWGSNQSTDPKYVPMSWCGENPNLPSDYSGYVLVFNEPEVKFTMQYHLSRRYKQIHGS